MIGIFNGLSFAGFGSAIRTDGDLPITEVGRIKTAIMSGFNAAQGDYGRQFSSAKSRNLGKSFRVADRRRFNWRRIDDSGASLFTIRQMLVDFLAGDDFGTSCRPVDGIDHKCREYHVVNDGWF